MALIVGIDVGGTHADGVLLDQGRVIVKKKLPVNQEDLTESLIPLLKHLTEGVAPSRIHLSTTLCTNAIVNGEVDDVGMLVQAGPGMNPDFLQCGSNTIFLDGAIDHRGQIVKSFSPLLVDDAAQRFAERGITSLGIVTKFSQRNHLLEQQIAEQVRSQFTSISLGHLISGLPNFPRRVYSTWLNAALTRKFTSFLKAMEAGIKDLSLTCPCSILKADGGTMPFSVAADLPCESVHSGPSASVMGCLALVGEQEDAVLLDIGGTTTDIALLADGVPLLAPYGATVLGRPTLIRALHTRSVGLGGDSQVRLEHDGLKIGPEKKGAPMALGGPAPTPSDALLVLERLQFGEMALAREAMLRLAPEAPVEETAMAILMAFCGRVKQEADLLIEEVFSRPVYSVTALLERKRLDPRTLIVVGGPAKAMQEPLAEVFALPCTVPENFEVANAIGAARTRPTFQVSLYADSSEGQLSIPEISCMEKISSSYSMQEAEARIEKVMAGLATQYGVKETPPIEYLEREEMNTIRGFRTTGKILTLKAQLRPGLDSLSREGAS
jgi:N-methylhydantoinase A/oxoprolinase/acetone carboxylase beta subunit